MVRRFVAGMFVMLIGVSPARSDIDAILSSAIPDDSPGCVVSVSDGGVVVYEGARGLADLDYNLALTQQSIFYIASDSKQFTAFAIALLADRGALRLSDRVTRWIPELPARVYGEVTIDELVHHTSGIRDYWGLLDLQGIPATSPFAQAQFVELIARQEALNFPPGERFEYSNSGYALLAIIVARASGKTLPAFAADEIFKPLGMKHTSYGADHLLPLSDRAVGYHFADNTFRIDPSAIEPLGDGGVRTSAQDLMRWLKNLAYNRLGAHPDAIARLIQSPGTSARGAVSYGFGIGISSRDGYEMLDHTGSYGGYESFVAWVPKSQLGIAALCNAENAGFTAWSVGLNVLDRYLGVPPSPSPAASSNEPSIALAPDQLSKLRGSYTEPDGTVWTISGSDGTIQAHVQGLTFALRAMDQSHLIAVGAPQPLQIAITESGLTLRIGNAATERLAPFTPPALTRREVDDYAGIYRSAELKLTFRVYAQRGSLYVDRDLAQPQQLGPIGRDIFTIGPRNLRFVRNARGAVTGLELSAGGVDALIASKTAST